MWRSAGQAERTAEGWFGFRAMVRALIGDAVEGDSGQRVHPVEGSQGVFRRGEMAWALAGGYRAERVPEGLGCSPRHYGRWG